MSVVSQCLVAEWQRNAATETPDAEAEREVVRFARELFLRSICSEGTPAQRKALRALIRRGPHRTHS